MAGPINAVFCRSCRAPIDSADDFCKKCGADQRIRVQPTLPAPASVSPKRAGAVPSKPDNSAAVALVSLVGFGFLCFVIWLASNGAATVTVKQLRSEHVEMNGKTVKLRAVVVLAGDGGKIGGKECGWLTDSYKEYLDYREKNGYWWSGSTKQIAVAVMPVPPFGNGTIVEIEGVYDGEADIIHMTSCISTGVEPEPPPHSAAVPTGLP